MKRVCTWATKQFAEPRQEIRIRVDSGVHRDRTRIGRHVVACILDRRPCTFEKQPLLRVHPLRFARSDVEERRVEEIDIVKNPFGFDEIRITQKLRRNGLLQLVVGKETYALDAVPQVLPELARVSGARKTAVHTDDCNGVTVHFDLLCGSLRTSALSAFDPAF